MLTVLMLDDDKGDTELLRREVSVLCKKVDFMSVFGHEMGLWRIGRYSPSDDDVPNVIVLEAVFSDGSSVDIIRAIRKSKAVKSVPIVIFTNADNTEKQRECLAEGATKVFYKSPGKKGVKDLAAYIASLASS